MTAIIPEQTVSVPADTGISTPAAGITLVDHFPHRSWCTVSTHNRRLAAERKAHGDAAGWNGCASRTYRAKAGRYTLTGALLDIDPDAGPKVSVEIIRHGKLAWSALDFTLDELQAVHAFLARLDALATGE